MIGVVGSTGFVGRHLVNRLVAEGLPVRGIARDPSRVTVSVDTRAADLLEPGTLPAALEGVETVVHCAAVTADRKEAYRGQYRRVHVDGTRNLMQAAKRSGARIVLLNGLGTRPAAPGSYMQTRWEMGEAVCQSGLPWVALQPSVLFGAGAAFPAAFARLARRSPVMPLLNGGRLKLQPLWIEDLVTCLLACVREQRWDGRAIDLGGPEYLTMAEVVDLVMETTRIRRLKVPLPIPVARVQAKILGVLPRPPLTPATLELFDFDNITDLDVVPRTFGFQPRSIKEHFRSHGLD